MKFEILKKSKKSRARLGVIETSHGVLNTPAFFPVATQGAIKTLDSQDIEKLGYQGVLCNTYHLMLRPGSAVIKKQGGLHKFMNFQGVIATDSGGFQVFSLGKGIEQGVGKIAKIFPGKIKSGTTNLTKYDGRRILLGGKNIINNPTAVKLVKIREDGVYFKSHIDGKEQFLSPEKSIKIQQDLDADIIFAFDECTSPLDNFEYTKKAMERTHRWAIRCLKQHLHRFKLYKNGTNPCDRRNLSQKLGSRERRSASSQSLFGIVQGGEYKKLREQSAKFIGSLPFDGFGIGGSLGKTKQKMWQILDWTISLLPEEKPRHLLGIGYLEDLEKSIQKGVDLFDCVYPTRLARHGIAIISENKNLNLQKVEFLKDKEPIDENCQCPTCQNYSRAYVSHLFRANEISAQRLLTLHNLWFFKNYIDDINKKIANGKL